MPSNKTKEIQSTSNDSVLLLDWGNSQLKSLVVQKSETVIDISHQQASITDLATLGHLLDKVRFADIAIATVNQQSAENDLITILKKRDLSYKIARTTKFACGVECAYDRPADMGIDRWLAVIAANHLFANAAIIDIGSAITIDWVDNGKHLGGQIAPGKALLEKSLQLTARVNVRNGTENDQSSASTSLSALLGQSTAACVSRGTDSMIKGYLINTIAQIKQLGQPEHWLLCGGGSREWTARLQKVCPSFENLPGLVFAGLKLWLDEQDG